MMEQLAELKRRPAPGSAAEDRSGGRGWLAMAAPAKAWVWMSLVLPLALAGCTTSSERGALPVPISQVYKVQAGDTLYSIGWRYGLDYRELAQTNGLQPPYTIYPGQKLRLAAPVAARAPTPGSASATPPKTAPKPARQTAPSATPATASRTRSPAKAPATASRTAPSPAAPPVASGAWQWPTSSPVTREFGGVSKGLDFSVAAGTPVRASAAGEVVYAGAGLGGFQHLVILKHDERHLSAYGLNQPIAVREGQKVNAQERIANIGSGAAAARTLHFEIRRDGKPVSPRTLLRKR